MPAALAPVAFVLDVTDSAGNTYVQYASEPFEANPPNVNEGFRFDLWLCQSSVAPLVKGVDTVTVTWSDPVYDRSVFPFLLRHVGGVGFPNFLGQAGVNDNAVFASNQVTLQSPAFTPARSNALEFAFVVSAKAGGVGGFGDVPGFVGFFQAQFHPFTGSKQTYLVNTQTHGADIVLRVDSGGNAAESDAGYLEEGVPIAAFDGVGQTYSAGANAWKGIVLLSFE